MNKYILALITALLIALGTGYSVAYSANNASNSTSDKNGDTCKVTQGINKGEKGEYSEGGEFCEGDWGATECRGNRCADTKPCLLYTSPSPRD